MMPSFLAAAARVPAGQAAAVNAVNKDSIRRFITRSQPKHPRSLNPGIIILIINTALR